MKDKLVRDVMTSDVVITHSGLAPRRPVGVVSMTDVVREMAP
jgi:hypothetical protein